MDTVAKGNKMMNSITMPFGKKQNLPKSNGQRKGPVDIQQPDKEVTSEESRGLGLGRGVLSRGEGL